MRSPLPRVGRPGCRHAASSVTGYHGSSEEAKANKAFFEAVLKSWPRSGPRTRAPPRSPSPTTPPTRPPSRAPDSPQHPIWNSSVANVKLQEGGSADFTYREGNDPRGSYASTDGHGSGYIFLDYAQNQEYDSTRVTAHETGHVLGLPDHYEGPCSELMSGGGPGPSCTNAIPTRTSAPRWSACGPTVWPRPCTR